MDDIDGDPIADDTPSRSPPRERERLEDDIPGKQGSFRKRQDQIKARKQKEQEDAAKVYAQFVESFKAPDPTDTSKTFVRGGIMGGDPDAPQRTGLGGAPADDDEDTPRRGLGAAPKAPSKGPPGIGAAPLFVSAGSTAKKPTSPLPFVPKASTLTPAKSAPSPTSVFQPATVASAVANNAANQRGKRKRGAEKDGKKKNIDLFMEEMKREQEMREKRKKSGGRGGPPPPGGPGGPPEMEIGGPPIGGPPIGINPHGPGLLPTPVLPPIQDDYFMMLSPNDKSGGDPTTTNIYVGNLAPDVTEQLMVREFGIYGDIASVKIMWPRTEEEHRRQRNCGFVSFMRRDDAEECMRQLQSKNINGHVIRLDWGKAVTIPSQPLVLKHNGEPEIGSWAPTVPPPVIPIPQQEEFVIPAGAIKYEIIPPADKKLRRAIDRLASFVSKLGHVFEKMIMEREMGNPKFHFLFHVRTNEHMYYRWKTYSLSQGDSVHTWRTAPFQMILGGPFWIPPKEKEENEKIKTRSKEPEKPPPEPPKPVNFHAHPPPKELTQNSDNPKEIGKERDSNRESSRTSKPADKEKDQDRRDNRERPKPRENERKGGRPSKPRREKGKLAPDDLDRFEDMLRGLTTDRDLIKDVMAFALDHAEEATEVVEILTDSLTLPETPITKKIGRLYAVSDILYNSSAPVKNASRYRSQFQNNLKTIFQGLNVTYANITGRITANAMKEKVIQVLRVWQAWSLFPQFFLGDLENIFLGKDKDKEREFESEPTTTPSPKASSISTPTTAPEGSVLTTPPTSGNSGPTGTIGGNSDSGTTSAEVSGDKVSEISKVEVPIDDDDLDGQPMQLNLLSSSYDSDKDEDEEDVDGTPLDSSSIGGEKKHKKDKTGGNKKSGLIIGGTGASPSTDDDDLDGAPLTSTGGTAWTVVASEGGTAASSSSSAASSSTTKSSDDDDLDGVPLP